MVKKVKKVRKKYYCTVDGCKKTFNNRTLRIRHEAKCDRPVFKKV